MCQKSYSHCHIESPLWYALYLGHLRLRDSEWLVPSINPWQNRVRSSSLRKPHARNPMGGPVLYISLHSHPSCTRFSVFASAVPLKQATLHFSTSSVSTHVAMVAGSSMKPSFSGSLAVMGSEWFSVLMSIYFLQLLSCPLDRGNHSLPLYLLSIYMIPEIVLDAINLERQSWANWTW